VCDERQLDELLRLDGGDGFVTKVLQLFIEEAEHLASRLPELADTPDVLASEAHKLKGAAGYVGAMRAAYFCGIVENAAASSHSQFGQTAVAEFKESLTVSIDDYRKRLRENDFLTVAPKVS
jgi:HPt (histidine-containing phosphotransfer) domain-containing protein